MNTNDAKVWLKKQWTKLKGWTLGVLITLGVVSGGVAAATANFTYERATTYDDGTAMPLEDIDFTRLYCDGIMVAEESGADGDFSVILGFGRRECYATHVVTIADTPESDPSNTIVRVITPGKPGKPTLNP